MYKIWGSKRFWSHFLYPFPWDILLYFHSFYHYIEIKYVCKKSFAVSTMGELNLPKNDNSGQALLLTFPFTLNWVEKSRSLVTYPPVLANHSLEKNVESHWFEFKGDSKKLFPPFWMTSCASVAWCQEDSLIMAVVVQKIVRHHCTQMHFDSILASTYLMTAITSCPLT